MSRVAACVVARTTSTRLPLKVLRTVDGHHGLLEFLLRRLGQCKKLDGVCLCTSQEACDDILEDVAKRVGCSIYRGSAIDVGERLKAVAARERADYVVRITGDNVLTSVEYLDRQIEIAVGEQLDYVRLEGVPLGATAEVIRVVALEHCTRSLPPEFTEYLMLYLFQPDVYRCGVLLPLAEDYSHHSLTVDTPQDLERTRWIFSRLDPQNSLKVSLKDIVTLHQRESIPNFETVVGGTIRLPGGKTMSAVDFFADIRARRNGSSCYDV